MTSDHLDKWLSTCLVQTDAHWSSTPGSANFYPHCDQAPSQMPCFYPHSPLIRSAPKGLREQSLGESGRRGLLTWWGEVSTGSKTGQAAELPPTGTGVPA